jgi:hypothetical protein
MAFIITLGGCGTTSFLDNHWFNPTTTSTYTSFKKVLAVAFVGNEANRRAAETTLANALGRNNSIAAHSYPLSDTLYKTKEVIKEELQHRGFDAALVLRCVEKEKDLPWIPGTNFGIMSPGMMMANNGLLLQNGVWGGNMVLNQWGMAGFTPM